VWTVWGPVADSSELVTWIELQLRCLQTYTLEVRRVGIPFVAGKT
jgi:hypothetical protein